MSEPEQLHGLTEAGRPTKANIAAGLSDSVQPQLFLFGLGLRRQIRGQICIPADQILHTGIGNDHRIQELMMPGLQSRIFLPLFRVFNNAAHAVCQQDSQIRGIVGAVGIAEISAEPGNIRLIGKFGIGIERRADGEFIIGSCTNDQLFRADIQGHIVTDCLEGQSLANRDAARLVGGIHDRDLAPGHLISAVKRFFPQESDSVVHSYPPSLYCKTPVCKQVFEFRKS